MSYYMPAATGEPTPGAEEPEDERRDLAVDKPFLGVKMGMEMSAVDLARTTDDLAKLVELRNRLVHHLIEDFNVWALDAAMPRCSTWTRVTRPWIRPF